jgi:hypothetical protein
MVYKSYPEYKYIKVHSESEEIFSDVQDQHQTSYLNIRVRNKYKHLLVLIKSSHVSGQVTCIAMKF